VNYLTNFYSQWSQGDGRTIDKAKFQWNVSGSYADVETKALSGDWANFTQTVPFNVAGSTLGYKVICNNTWGEETTATGSFFVVDPSPVNNIVGHNQTVANQNTLFYSEWSVGGGGTLDEVTFFWDTDEDLVFENETVSLSDGWANVTKFIEVSWQGRYITYYFIANNTYGNETTTGLQGFTVAGLAPIYSSVSSTEGLGNIENDFTCYWDKRAGQSDIAQVIFSWNATGSFVNETITITGTPTWANVTKTNPKLYQRDVYYIWYAQNLDGYWNNTGFNSWTIPRPVPDEDEYAWEYIDFYKTIARPKNDPFGYWTEDFTLNWNTSSEPLSLSRVVNGYGWMRSDLADVSFWSYNGTKLNHWIKGNKAYVAIPYWVTNTTSPNGMYCRWADESDTTVENTTADARKVFRIYDPFDSLNTTMWEISGSASVTDGVLTLDASGGSDAYIRSVDDSFNFTVSNDNPDIEMQMRVSCNQNRKCRFGWYYNDSWMVYIRRGDSNVNDECVAIEDGDLILFADGSGSYNWNDLSGILLEANVNYYSREADHWLFWGHGGSTSYGDINLPYSTQVEIIANPTSTVTIDWIRVWNRHAKPAYEGGFADFPVESHTWVIETTPSFSENNNPTTTSASFTNLNDDRYIFAGLEKDYDLELTGNDIDGASDLSLHEFALELDGDKWINGTYYTSSSTCTLDAGSEYGLVMDSSHSSLMFKQTVTISIRFASSTPLTPFLDCWYQTTDSSSDVSGWTEYTDLAQIILYEEDSDGGGGSPITGGTDDEVENGDEDGETSTTDIDQEYLIEIKNPLTGEAINLIPIPWKWTRAQKLAVLWILLILILLLMGAVYKQLKNRQKEKRKNAKSVNVNPLIKIKY